MTSGPSIADRIGQAITKAWEAFDGASREARSDPWADAGQFAENAGKARQARGRVLGLAQALAILRHAPNAPTGSQIIEIAQEFYPTYAGDEDE